MATGRGNHEQYSEASSGSTARRFADQVHEGVDRVAEHGERLESRLHDGREQIDEEAHRLATRVSTFVRRSPWLALGGSVAIGFMIGALSHRR